MAEHPRTGADVGVRKDHRGRAEGRAGIEVCRADPQQPVVEQVRHQAPAAVDGGPVVEGDHVVLGDRGRLTPHAPADLRAHRPQVHGHDRRAHREAQQPLVGQLLLRRVHHLVAPDEAAPQRMLAPAVAADQDPLHRDRHRRGDERAGDQHERRRDDRPDEPVVGADRRQRHDLERLDHEHDRVGHEQPQQIHHAAGELQPPGRIDRARRIGGVRYPRQLERRNSEPRAFPRPAASATASSRRAGCRRRAGSRRAGSSPGRGSCDRRPRSARSPSSRHATARRRSRCHPCTG